MVTECPSLFVNLFLTNFDCWNDFIMLISSFVIPEFRNVPRYAVGKDNPIAIEPHKAQDLEGVELFDDQNSWSR